MTTGTTWALARWAAEVSPGDIPENVRHEGVRAFVNWLGCAVGGATHETVDRALQALPRFSGPPRASVLGRTERLDELHAALINGIASHVLDYDDTHLKTIIHPAGPVASALLAVEGQDVSGRDFLTALIVGVEVECRIVRENNEGFQPDRNVVAGSGEFRSTEDVTISVRVITRAGSYRVARAALEIARQRRKRLTIAHKDTVFKLGCGMFVEECYRAAKDFPDLAVDGVIVDTFAMRLVRDPQTFDVVLTTNMFGDILADEAAGLVGGLGMAPGLCIGEGSLAMAQATHGPAPDIAGQGIANPYAMIESTRMLVEWLGHNRGIGEAVSAAAAMTKATTAALADPTTRTRDIRGTADTSGMTGAIVTAIAEERVDAIA